MFEFRPGLIEFIKYELALLTAHNKGYSAWSYKAFTKTITA